MKKSSFRFKETCDGQVKPMGVFMCDGQTVSRSILDKKDTDEILTKSLQCGYCGNVIRRGAYLCSECSQKTKPKARINSSELPYRSELNIRLWQANISPPKDTYPVVGIPRGASDSIPYNLGVPGSANMINSASNSLSTMTDHCTLTSPKYKPNMHTNPEW